MANKKINSNGHSYIDLGLPSGTLWAATNVGAQKPTESGLYFSWADVQGYTAEQVGKDKQFSCDDYKWGIYPNFTKYAKQGEMLEIEDDAARANWGGDWHIPTREQVDELINNTISNWIAQDGVNGRLFTSKNNDKSIFIPVAGGASFGSVYGRGLYGNVWSSMLSSSDVDNGQGLNVNSDGAYLNGYYCRDNGFSVRGVIG